ncbi:MAG: hypothetical protein BZY79_01775 [SAR202 cluster bacterium Casp-Chloro-G4]|nr:MAG: hypothetical protein BZY79_01775 [SAR202 cluster bacterium Casp-Chloro-G4]
MKKYIEKKRTFNSPIKRVWEAITREEEISKWFMQANFKAEKGYSYEFEHESIICHGTVLEVDPPNKLVYTWINPGTTEETTVTWLLEETNGGTELTLIHRGYEKYSDDDAEKFFKENEFGWNMVIQGLDEYLNLKS